MIDLGKLICNINVGGEQSLIKVVETLVDERKIVKFEANELQFITKDVSDDILTDLKNLKVYEQLSDEENDIHKNNDIKSILPSSKHMSLNEDSGGSTVWSMEPAISKRPDVEQLQTVRKGQRTNVAMEAILRQAAVPTDNKSSGPEKEASIGTTKQVQFQSSYLPYGCVGETSTFEKVCSREGMNRGECLEDSRKPIDGSNARRERVFRSNNLKIEHSVLPTPGHVDFSVPPPSFPLRNTPNSVINSIPNAISDSLIS
jgi:hypothetical protein